MLSQLNPRQREILFRIGLTEHPSGSTVEPMTPEIRAAETIDLLMSGYITTSKLSALYGHRLTTAGLLEVEHELRIVVGDFKFRCEEPGVGGTPGRHRTTSTTGINPLHVRPPSRDAWEQLKKEAAALGIKPGALAKQRIYGAPAD